MDILTGLVIFISTINWSDSFILQSKTNEDYLFIMDHDACYMNGEKLNGDCIELAVNLANLNYPDVKFAKISDPWNFEKWSKLPLERRHVVVYFESYNVCEPFNYPCDISTIMVCDRKESPIVIRSLTKDIISPYRDIVKLRRTFLNRKDTKIYKDLDNPHKIIKPPGPSPVNATLLGTSSNRLFYTILFSKDEKVKKK